MRPFNVLDPAEDVHRSYLLEASAGTGKTFAIENIIVRKLLEGDSPLTLNQILIVTFTNAAVNDLKRRIYQNLRKAFLSTRDPKIDDALQTFHEASIFTIHGFCSRMLQEDPIEAGVGQASVGNIPPSVYKRILTDFLQVIFNRGEYSLRQMEILKGSHPLETLIVTLKVYVDKGIPAERLPPLAEQKNELERLWNEIGPNPLEVIQRLVPAFKGIPKDHDVGSTPISGKDFDALLNLANEVVSKITPQNKKARPKVDAVIPPALEVFRDTALRYASAPYLLSDLVEKCRLHVENYCTQEDILSFDLLLKKMKSACRHTPFVKKIQEKYKLALVDEFQDTDPLQWEIFQTLFCENGQLILVGDPKQSIYGFRQADIYTYREAGRVLGDDALRTLETNYRSTPQLVAALNALFDASHTPGWIPLPKSDSEIVYHPVKAGRTDQANEGGIVVQMADDEEQLMRAIANTIIEKELPLDSTAVLIKDRHQAKRMAKFLREAQIPYVLQHRDSLTKSTVWSHWNTLLEAILAPKNSSLIKQALGTTFIGFSHLELGSENFPQALLRYMDLFIQLRELWLERGIGAVIEKLNSDPLFYADSLTVRLLKFEEGDVYLQSLFQIQEIYLEEEAKEKLSPRELVLRGKEIQSLSSEEDERVSIRQDVLKPGVKILTIHSSKGLEFEAVFTPGIIHGRKFKDTLIPHGYPERMLVPFLDKKDLRLMEKLEEDDAEKMRQLYVALTRARKWLYIPFIPIEAKRELFGAASPGHLFFSRMGQPLEKDLRKIYERIPDLSFDEIEKRLPRHEAMTCLKVNSEQFLKYQVKDVPMEYTSPTIPTIPGHSIVVESFTSLSHPSPMKGTRESFESNDPVPAGAETGIVLHTIFEKIAYDRPSPLAYLKGTLLEPFAPQVENMVKKSVEYCFPEGFTLAEIPPAQQFREMEFLYSTPTGYLKGVIDLIFIYKGKIHIVDWKSNLLSDYTTASLREAMHHHDYFLQAKLYKEAAIRYFGNYPVVIDYFFLRGPVPYRVEEKDVE